MYPGRGSEGVCAGIITCEFLDRYCLRRRRDAMVQSQEPTSVEKPLDQPSGTFELSRRAFTASALAAGAAAVLPTATSATPGSKSRVVARAQGDPTTLVIAMDGSP